MSARRGSVDLSAKAWIEHARSDLRLAKLVLHQDILPEQICFHAQQAVEKSLKAVLIHAVVDFPFTHDLQELLVVMEAARIDIPDELREVDSLTPYAVETRYPGFWGEITGQDVEEALRLAEQTVSWAERFVQSP